MDKDDVQAASSRSSCEWKTYLVSPTVTLEAISPPKKPSFDIDQLASRAVLGSTNEPVERWRGYPSPHTLQQVNHHDATKPSVSGGPARGNGAKQPQALDHLDAQPSFG